MEELGEPKEHKLGYVWYIEQKEKHRPVVLAPTAQSFTDLALQVLKFIGQPRDFPPSKAERAKKLQAIKLQEELKRRIAEEKLVQEAERLRIAEENRIAELQYLREKYQKDEEKRVLELAVPLRKYLSATVLGDLIDGLVETAKVRPSDPVRFLGEFLMDKAVK
ncbi:Dpy-30_motif-containing protein [Hexamita inflata]|nr:Dpy-30 motif-containing protein [Hexamita inflata]